LLDVVPADGPFSPELVALEHLWPRGAARVAPARGVGAATP
jgi:hypothetical protein